MKIYTTSQETYRLLYTYRLPKSLTGTTQNILNLHLKTKQEGAHLFFNHFNDYDETILNVIELISMPINQNIKITTGIEGVSVRLDLLNSEEINNEISDFKQVQLVV